MNKNTETRYIRCPKTNREKKNENNDGQKKKTLNIWLSNFGQTEYPFRHFETRKKTLLQGLWLSKTETKTNVWAIYLSISLALIFGVTRAINNENYYHDSRREFIYRNNTAMMMLIKKNQRRFSILLLDGKDSFIPVI